MPHSRRVLILPLAAVLIIGLVAYKLRWNNVPQTFQESHAQGDPAPLFQLYDQKSRMFRLGTYFGRHKLVVVFFDSTAGADRNPQLLELRREFDKLEATGAIVLAISPATPYANRLALARGGSFPFSLLSDPDFQVHRAWGTFSTQTEGNALAPAQSQPLPAVFVVDRRGQIVWSQVGEQEVVPVSTIVAQLQSAAG